MARGQRLYGGARAAGRRVGAVSPHPCPRGPPAAPGAPRRPRGRAVGARAPHVAETPWAWRVAGARRSRPACRTPRGRPARSHAPHPRAAFWGRFFCKSLFFNARRSEPIHPHLPKTNTIKSMTCERLVWFRCVSHALRAKKPTPERWGGGGAVHPGVWASCLGLGPMGVVPGAGAWARHTSRRGPLRGRGLSPCGP